MPTDVARYFSASCRMSDMDGISEIELLGQLRKIIRIRIHIIAVPRLRGAAMPPPVVRDNAITVLAEEQHLGVPVIRTERPAVSEDYRLSLSPVLVEDCRAIFGRDCCQGIALLLCGLKIPEFPGLPPRVSAPMGSLYWPVRVLCLRRRVSGIRN